MPNGDPDQQYVVHRALEVFKREDDCLAHEYSLDHIDLRALRELVNHPSDEPMIFGYDLDESQAIRVAEMLGIPLDFEKYIH